MPVKLNIDPGITAHRCPECGGSLRVTPNAMPEHAICPKCAAVAIFDTKKRFYRMLRTQEWMDLSILPQWWDLLEDRQRVLERITSPNHQKKPDGPRQASA